MLETINTVNTKNKQKHKAHGSYALIGWLLFKPLLFAYSLSCLLCCPIIRDKRQKA